MRAVLLAMMLIWCVVLQGPAVCAAQVDIPDRPLTLDDCIAIALRHNPQIASSQQAVISARAALTRARSTYYPQLSLSAVEGFVSRSSSLSLGGGTSGSGSDTRQELDLTLGTTLWQSGRKEAVDESRASLRAAELDHASTAQALVEQVANGYYGALAAQELVAVAEAGVESARLHLEEVKARIAVGATAAVDTFPAEDDLARAQLDLIDARSNARLALAQLKNTLGLKQETDIRLAPSAVADEEPVPSTSEAIQTALEHRPELLASRASLRAASYALAQAKIRRGPIADISGQYAKGFTDWEARDPSWDFLLSLSWPLLDGQARKADETAARAALRRSEAELQRLTNQVSLEVESALVEVARTRERLQTSAKSVAAAEARLAAAEGKYRQGVGILLEVIDARVSVTSARASQIQARYDYQKAIVALRRALGTLPAVAAVETEGR